MQADRGQGMFSECDTPPITDGPRRAGQSVLWKTQLSNLGNLVRDLGSAYRNPFLTNRNPDLTIKLR